MRKSTKCQNIKSDVLTIGTVCCGYRKVAWIQNMFQVLAILQILPLETWGRVRILFAKTLRSAGGHSTFFMKPLRYTTHPHITNYITFALLDISQGNLWCSTDATPNVSQYIGDLYTPDVTKCMMTAKWWRIINYTQASDQRWQETKETGATAYTMRINIL